MYSRTCKLSRKIMLPLLIIAVVGSFPLHGSASELIEGQVLVQLDWGYPIEPLIGGFGQAVADYLLANGYTGRFKALGIPDRFITHGSRDLLLKEIGLDPGGIAVSIEELVANSLKQGSFLKKLIFRKNGNARKKADSIPAKAGSQKT